MSGRKVNNHSKFGRLINERGLRLYDVCHGTRIGYARLGEYINLRRPWSSKDLRIVAEFFDVEPEDLIGV